MSVIVRRVQASDAQLVKEIRLRSLASDPLSFGSTYEREAAFENSSWDEWAAGDAEGDETATYLALADDAPVGIVAAYRDDDDSALYHVIAMWVAPETRRQGLARRLLTAIEGWIAHAGGAEVQLFVTDAAAEARALYLSAGYRPDGRATPSRHTEGLTETSLRKSLK